MTVLYRPSHDAVNKTQCLHLPSAEGKPEKRRIGRSSPHLPDSDVGRWFRERPLEHATHLEGVRVNLCDVVENDQDGSQRVDAGEETDVAKEQEELQVVIERALSEQTSTCGRSLPCCGVKMNRCGRRRSPGTCSCRPPAGPGRPRGARRPAVFSSSGLYGSSFCCVSSATSKAGRPP